MVKITWRDGTAARTADKVARDAAKQVKTMLTRRIREAVGRVATEEEAALVEIVVTRGGKEDEVVVSAPDGVLERVETALAKLLGGGPKGTLDRVAPGDDEPARDADGPGGVS